jgi:hypothetical protein
MSDKLGREGSNQEGGRAQDFGLLARGRTRRKEK